MYNTCCDNVAVDVPLECIDGSLGDWEEQKKKLIKKKEKKKPRGNLQRYNFQSNKRQRPRRAADIDIEKSCRE